MTVLLLLCCGTGNSAVAPVAAARGDAGLLRLAASAPDAQVQVIVQSRQAATAEAAAGRLGGAVVQRLPVISGFTARLTARQAWQLAQRPEIKFVSLDRPVAPTGTSGNRIDTSQLATAYPDAANAKPAWSRGYTGAGVGVAVLDSGVTQQPDFGTRLVAQVSTNPNATSSADGYGHGTHVAGIIAGNDQAGQYIGIAPDANIISVKMSDDSAQTSVSDAIAAIQWVYDNRKTYNIRVVNISATSGYPISYQDDPLDAAVEKLWFAGIVVVAAAGNRGGQDCATCYAPANDPFVITVGAIDDGGTRQLNDDLMPAWSSTGPTQDGFAKPEILAPGAHMVSVLAAPDDGMATQWPQNVVDGRYFRMGGTSTAAPVVAGVAALILQANPRLTPSQVKWLVTHTARQYHGQLAGTPGIVNGSSAVDAAIGPKAPGLANAGVQPSSSLDRKTGTIHYSNVFWQNVFWQNVFWQNDPNM